MVFHRFTSNPRLLQVSSMQRIIGQMCDEEGVKCECCSFDILSSSFLRSRSYYDANIEGGYALYSSKNPLADFTSCSANSFGILIKGMWPAFK